MKFLITYECPDGVRRGVEISNVWIAMRTGIWLDAQYRLSTEREGQYLIPPTQIKWVEKL